MNEIKKPRTLDAVKAKEVRSRLGEVELNIARMLANPSPKYVALPTGPCDYKGRPDCPCGGPFHLSKEKT